MGYVVAPLLNWKFIFARYFLLDKLHNRTYNKLSNRIQPETTLTAPASDDGRALINIQHRHAEAPIMARSCHPRRRHPLSSVSLYPSPAP